MNTRAKPPPGAVTHFNVITMSEFDDFLQKAKDFHGHLCGGIVLGTRLTLAGLRELGMNPREPIHDLIVYIEIDRCGTDAV